MAGLFDGATPAPAFEDRDGTRTSAVLAPLFTVGGVTHLVLTRRAQHLRSHRGEVSFPGGGREPHDPDLRTTALREAYEEVCLEPTSVEIVGELDHLLTFSRKAYIVPFVGAVAEPPSLVPDPLEVERILEVPLRELLLPETYRQELWDFAGQERSMHFFDLVDDTVWGATAAMLVNLLRVLTDTYEGPDWHARWA